MSFGFGLGDVIAIGKLSWTIYTKLHNAPTEIKAIGDDIGLLSVLITSVDASVYRIASMTPKIIEGLQDAIIKCKAVLEEVETLMAKYHGGKLKFYDRWKWSTQDVAGIHGRVRTALSVLTAFNASIAK